MKNNFIEYIVTISIVVISFLLLNPFNFWMPDMLFMGMLVLALVVFGIYASFMLREQVVDERDSLHRTLAGRNAFLVGSGLLTVAIVVEGYTHSIDPWLVVIFIAMVLTKLITRRWTDTHL